MMKTNQFTRRQFLSRTAAGTAAGISAIHIVPSTVFGAPNRPAPSDQLRFGNIGCGGRGRGFIRPGSSIALCDVDANRLAEANKRVQGKAKLYHDYRDLLAQEDIDAVFITTPDHWHALMTIHACEAGKDVYVEKPACKTVEEGRKMVEAAERYARVVQVGSQGRSQDGANIGKRFIDDGQIGPVKEVRCWHYENPAGDWTPDQKPPAKLDYDAWIGPNRWIPYNPTHTHGNFRWMMDFGGGQIRDRGAHTMSIANWVMGCDDTGPVKIESKGHQHFKGQYDIPQLLEVKYHFKNPAWTLVWAMPGEPHIEGVNIKPDRQWRSYGAYYVGEDDNLIITYGDGSHTQTEEKAKKYVADNYGIENVIRERHRANFETCIRTREKPVMHIEAGHRVATLCILGNISLYLGRDLEWDPVNERVLQDEEANRLLSKPGRGEYYI